MLDDLLETVEKRLVQVRWLSVATMALGTGLYRLYLDAGPPFLALAASVVALALVNAALARQMALQSSGRSGDGVLGRFASSCLAPAIQLYLDLLAWSWFIFLTGGATNPLISVLLPLVALAAMALDTRQAWLFGACALAAYSVLWQVHVPLAIGDVRLAGYLHIFGMWLVFVVSTVIVIWFIRRMVAEMAERNAALDRLRERAERDGWLVSMGALATGAAHELSTPLGTLGLLVDELLLDEQLPPAAAAEVRAMQRELQACRNALDHLVCRAGVPRTSMPASMALGDWIRSIAESCSAINPSVEVQPRITETAGNLDVRPDPSIERSLINLLNNAIQAGATRLVIDCERTEGGIRLTITDNGSGITPGALERFRNGERSTSDLGLGIGLLFVRASVERLGGRLRLDNLADGGTIAELSLPATFAT